MIIKKIKNNKAFVLLFAVVISSIILAVTLGVLNIALKEINFSTSSKDTDDAFYAADTGVECALYYDKDISVLQPFPSRTVQPSMMCAGFVVDENLQNPDDNFWTFSVLGLGSSGKSCAFVSILKDSGATPAATSIISKGYNVADTTGDNCVPNSKSVERQLEVNY
jgi:hypothetical protein